jgi:hypothetical protein
MDDLKDKQWLESLQESGKGPWQVRDPAHVVGQDLEYAESG